VGWGGERLFARRGGGWYTAEGSADARREWREAICAQGRGGRGVGGADVAGRLAMGWEWGEGVRKGVGRGEYEGRAPGSRRDLAYAAAWIGPARMPPCRPA